MAQSFYLVAKFAESAAFLIIYPFSAELFPTAVRGVGIGFAAYVGGIGLVVIPFINYLVRGAAICCLSNYKFLLLLRSIAWL
jgi:hypothetical protein